MQLARYGLNTTSPNPRVGCLIVSQGEIIGEGWHVRAGQDHAEIIALKQAGSRSAGATCYLTLEPCTHTGRTPPCSKELVRARVARVVVAMVDPNPLVAGKGLQELAESGIIVMSGLLESAAARLNPGFIKRMNSKLPYVRVKMAMSLDGRVALANGQSKWITGEHARLDVQRLRALSCAVMTGSGTVLADNPLLTVREMDTRGRKPLRVILDRRLQISAHARLFSDPGRIIIFTKSRDSQKKDSLVAGGADVVVVEDTEFAGCCLGYLAKNEEINEVLVEAGPRLAGSLLRDGLVDELVLYQAPVLLGDKAMGVFNLPSLENMDERMNVTLVDVRHVGRDLRFIYRFDKRGVSSAVCTE